jgi:hypothetical protein
VSRVRRSGPAVLREQLVQRERRVLRYGEQSVHRLRLDVPERRHLHQRRLQRVRRARSSVLPEQRLFGWRLLSPVGDLRRAR